MLHSWEEGSKGVWSAPDARRSWSASLKSEWQLPCAWAAVWVVFFTGTTDSCSETLLTTSAGDAWPAPSFACNRRGESSQPSQDFHSWSSQGRGVSQTINTSFGVWTPKLKLCTWGSQLKSFVAESGQLWRSVGGPLQATYSLPYRGGSAGGQGGTGTLNNHLIFLFLLLGYLSTLSLFILKFLRMLAECMFCFQSKTSTLKGWMTIPHRHLPNNKCFSLLTGNVWKDQQQMKEAA